MLEGIWYGIIAAFVFIGVTASAYIIIIHFFKADNRGRFLVVISSEESDEDIGSLLYGAHLRLCLLGDYCDSTIIILDNGMSEAQLKLCRAIMAECGNMELCSCENLACTVLENNNY